jgi:hypothetical protein
MIIRSSTIPKTPSPQLTQSTYQLPTYLPWLRTMFRSIVTVLTLASMAIATRQPGVCYEDNCYRAVQRKWQGMDVYTQHLRDCTANLACASTPAAFIATVTEVVTTGTSTVTLSRATNAPSPVNAVLTCGTNLPDYLTQQCDGQFTSYSSACSCASITASTSVAATPTITATVTNTVPASIVYV